MSDLTYLCPQYSPFSMLFNKENNTAISDDCTWRRITRVGGPTSHAPEEWKKSRVWKNSSILTSCLAWSLLMRGFHLVLLIPEERIWELGARLIEGSRCITSNSCRD